MSDVFNNSVDLGASGAIPEKFIKQEDSFHINFRYRDYSEEIIVSPFKKDPKKLVNKSIILYGLTGSGKSTVLRDFMYSVREYFPTTIAFAPTNRENHAYDQIIPDVLIYDSFGLGEIKEIHTRQQMMTAIYENANDVRILNKLFERVASPKARIYLDKIHFLKDKAVKIAENQIKEPADREVKLNEIKEIYRQKLVGIYKSVVKEHFKRLVNMRDLSKEERLCLHNLDINPNILVIFDDAFTEVMKLVKEGAKKNDQVIKNFFFKGRHANITHWYCFQDDKGIETDIRKNAMISVFTDKQAAIAFFNRPGNSFSTLEKKKAEAVINVIFSRENEQKFVKLIYSKMDRNNFSYVVADKHSNEEMTMCSKVTRDYCRTILDKDEKFDNSNPYLGRFEENINY